MAETAVEVKKAERTAAPALARLPAIDTWRSVRGEMDRLFDQVTRGFGFPSPWRMFEREPLLRYETPFGAGAPAIDMSEDDKSYRITAELPGMDVKDVEITASDNMLMISGEKREEKEEKAKNFYVCERRYGSFQRSLPLPESIDRDKIEAAFSKGVLTITLPKTAEAVKQQKKIAIASK